jgi:hypothetical protein
VHEALSKVFVKNKKISHKISRTSFFYFWGFQKNVIFIFFYNKLCATHVFNNYCIALIKTQRKAFPQQCCVGGGGDGVGEHCIFYLLAVSLVTVFETARIRVKHLCSSIPCSKKLTEAVTQKY